MENSWINLQQRERRPSGQEDEGEDVISGPSTASSASSIESLNSQKEALTASGSTDENLRASFGTILKKKPASTEEAAAASAGLAAEEKHRRDTITASSRPPSVERNKVREEARQAKKLAREEEKRRKYWSGFYAGVSVGISSMFIGFICWRFMRRLAR